MADTVDTQAEELANKIATGAKWTTPCTFDRINRMPIDAKSCFRTYQDLEEYLGDEETTAYPGMFLAVVDKNDTKRGAYVLMSTEEGTLVPTKLGQVSSIVVKGDGTPEEGDSGEIVASVDENGKATIALGEIQFEEINVDTLEVDGMNIYEMVPCMSPIRAITEIPDENNLNMTTGKINELIRTLKSIAEKQPYVPFDEWT